MVGSLSAGRHHTEAVAESLHLIYKHELGRRAGGKAGGEREREVDRDTEIYTETETETDKDRHCLRLGPLRAFETSTPTLSDILRPMRPQFLILPKTVPPRGNQTFKYISQGAPFSFSCAVIFLLFNPGTTFRTPVFKIQEEGRYFGCYFSAPSRNCGL